MKRGVIISILLHLGLVSLLFIGFFEYFKGPDSSNPEAEIIEAYSVDASTLKEGPKIPVKDTKQTDKTQIKQQLKEELKIQQQKKLEQEKKLQAEISLQEKKKKRLEQEIKLKELELKKKQQQDDLRKKQQAQKRLQIEEAKKQEKLKQEQEAKKAKLAEQERLATARRKEELAAGQAKEQALTNSIVSKYSVLIKQKMEKNWRRPADARNLVCTTKIKLLPDGSVLDVKVIKPSGSPDFDGSVINALYNAGTFPLPKEPKYRSLFTDDDLIMKFTN